jgi:hypothetical protein
MVVMKRVVSTGLMTIYWIALPFVTLGTVGIGWILLAPNASEPTKGILPLWVSLAVSVLLAVVLVWRLWVHARARRLANEAAAATLGSADR